MSINNKILLKYLGMNAFFSAACETEKIPSFQNVHENYSTRIHTHMYLSSWFMKYIATCDDIQVKVKTSVKYVYISPQCKCIRN